MGRPTRSDARGEDVAALPAESEAPAGDGDPARAARGVADAFGAVGVALRAVRADDPVPVELFDAESAEPPVSAEATGTDAIATPTPSATASPPTRPIQRA
ncbi:hypothetical protein [Mycobacterium sp. M26]|uniref:hypothetical protein n=1 Tax=Mycobacterium sp. M26 TaxID=1762962 RepID=UPI00073F30B5|nr:hypothetical protein [Mycobacterium sp. M26]